MNQQTPAGWYEDLDDPTFLHYRYWDGQAWTNLTSGNLSDIERAGAAGLETGRYGWASGFLAWIPIPFAGLIIAAIAMSLAYSRARFEGSALCTENARRATNWGLTILVFALVCVLYVVVVTNTVPDANQGFFPVGAVVIAYIVVVLAHTVITIAGTVKAGRGKVFNPGIAIPFIRASR